MKLIIIMLLLSVLLNCDNLNRPKQTVKIINTSSSETIYIYSAHCLENLDSILKPEKYYFDKGLNSKTKNPYFLDPKDTLNLALGFTLLPIINSCDDHEAKVLIVSESSLSKNKNKYIDKSSIDTIFSLSENSIRVGVFNYISDKPN